ncbi:MAG: molybdopterin dinucleotide binding domain-containing protein [Burkholderiaceae bacterium]
MNTTTVRAACPHDCPDTCAIRVTVQDGRAVKVQGDPAHPPTHGALCTKVSRYPERTYHAERVLHPMKRSGPRGSGRFVRVSWAEALADIAGRLKAIAARRPDAAQAIVPYSYAGTMGLVQGESMAARFFHRLGASLLDRTISPPARNFLNSSFVNVKSLRDIEGEPVVEIHEADARCRGIASGQMVRVFNDRGSTLCRAAVSPRARPGVVNGLGVWWRKLGADGTNVNELTHQRLTDLGRAPSFYDCLVDVRPADAAAS